MSSVKPLAERYIASVDRFSVLGHVNATIVKRMLSDVNSAAWADGMMVAVEQLTPHIHTPDGMAKLREMLESLLVLKDSLQQRLEQARSERG